MLICPKCNYKNDDKNIFVCKNCGYDESLDYAKYPTLQPLAENQPIKNFDSKNDNPPVQSQKTAQPPVPQRKAPRITIKKQASIPKEAVGKKPKGVLFVVSLLLIASSIILSFTFASEIYLIYYSKTNTKQTTANQTTAQTSEGENTIEKCEYPNGTVYFGELTNGSRNGTGILSDENNNVIYSGSWMNDLFDGEGTYYFPDGSSFHTTWKEGTCEDKHYITIRDKNSLDIITIGYFENNEFHKLGDEEEN